MYHVAYKCTAPAIFMPLCIVSGGGIMFLGCQYVCECVCA